MYKDFSGTNQFQIVCIKVYLYCIWGHNVIISGGQSDHSFNTFTIIIEAFNTSKVTLWRYCTAIWLEEEQYPTAYYLQMTFYMS